MKDDDLKIITVTQDNLNKKIGKLLLEDKMSTYDIRMEDVKITTRSAILKWVPRGYSIIFQYGRRSKILRYNK